jgi:hypothetical protein
MLFRSVEGAAKLRREEDCVLPELFFDRRARRGGKSGRAEARTTLKNLEKIFQS